MKKAIAYIRVSTQAQAGEDRFGLEAQKQAIEAYAEQHGIEILEYAEDHISGVKDNRPEFDRILYNTTELPEYLIVAKSDRVARDINLYFWYKMELKKRGVTLLCIDNDFAELGAIGDLLETFTMFAAQMERDNINKRCQGGRNVKAKLGGYSGGKPPLGYYASQGGLKVHPDESEIVKRIFSLVDSGKSMHSVAQQLTGEGVKTRSGGKFYTSTIKAIVDNRAFYSGSYKYGENDKVDGLHEAIIAA